MDKMNRLSFFKKSTLKAIPFLGLISSGALILNSCDKDDPILDEEIPEEEEPTGCSSCYTTAKSSTCSTCSGTAKSTGCSSCNSSCSGTSKSSGCLGCSSNCYTGCKTNCQATCTTDCRGACLQSCLAGCKTGCKGGCDGSAKCPYGHCYSSY